MTSKFSNPKLREASVAKTWAVVMAAILNLLPVSCSNAGEANTPEPRSVRAETTVLQSSVVADEFQAAGTIQARTRVVLSSRAVGQILFLAVGEGDRVRRGQIVAEIDGREAAAQLRRAQAAVGEAQRALEEVERGIEAAEAAVRAAEAGRDLAFATRKRYDVLRERRSLSPQEFDEVETKYKAAVSETERSQQALAATEARRLQVSARIEQAEAEVDAAQVALGYSKLAAPIDGVITARHAEPGTMAMPGLPLLAIEDDGSYELDVAVEESRAARVTVGQKARVEIDAYPGAAMDARVREIVPSADPATRTYMVKLEIPRWPGGHGIHSGFFGRAFFSPADRQALIIPESALTRRGQLEGVYIVQNGAAMLRLVKTGKRYGGNIEILSGLEAGARIVTAPTSEITDGVKVNDDTRAKKTS
jgi:membrane fusion protein, multidrug efflux system